MSHVLLSPLLTGGRFPPDIAAVYTDGVMTRSELRFSCAVKMCLKSRQRETRSITFYDIKGPRGCEANAVNLTARWKTSRSCCFKGGEQPSEWGRGGLQVEFSRSLNE